MICKRCGNVNARNSRFCRHCGARLEEPGAVTPLPEEEFEVRTESGDAEEPDAEEVNKLLERAFGLSERDDLAGAAFLCTQAIDLNSKSISAHSLLGLLYERMDRRDEAILEYERVVELNPGSTVDREHLERLRGQTVTRSQGQPEREPRQTRAWTLFGHSPYVSSVPIVAAATLGIVVMLFANRAAESGVGRGAGGESGAAQYLLAGKEYYRRGQFDAAKREFLVVQQIEPTNREAQQWLDHIDQRSRPKVAQLRDGPPQLVGGPPPPFFPEQDKPEEPARRSPATHVPRPPAQAPPLPAPLPSAQSSTPRQRSAARTRPNTRRTPSRTPAGLTAEPRHPATTPSSPSRDSGTRAAPEAESSAPPSRIVVQRSASGAPRPTQRAGPTPRTARTPAAAPDARALERQGARDLLNGKADAAADKYKRSLAASKADDPDVGFRHQQLATIHLNKGDYNAARSEYRKALGAYKEQLQKGVRTQDAERGVRACQLALKLCESNAPR